MNRAMTTILASAMCLAALGACKIVPNPEPGSGDAAAPLNDDQRMALKAQEIFDGQLVPYVSDRAIELPVLRSALEGGLDAAGAAHGVRPQAEGSPWNFLLKGEGTVTEANRESRAGTVALDVDSDGQPDLTVQLGPVIRGTSLRDAADFIVFTDYRDQIEFAKLARALNDRAHEAVNLPDGALAGKTYRFEGATTLRSTTEPLLVVPTLLEEVAP